MLRIRIRKFLRLQDSDLITNPSTNKQKLRKTLISTGLVLNTDVNVPSVSKLIYYWQLESHCGKEQDPLFNVRV